MGHEFLEMKIKKSEKGIFCACEQSGSKKWVDRKLFTIYIDNPFGFVQSSLTRVKEISQQKTTELQNYSIFSLRAKVCLNWGSSFLSIDVERDETSANCHK